MLETIDGFLQLWQAYCDKKEEVEDLKEQRTELLEALKEVAAWSESLNQIMPTWLDRKVDRAIAKAEVAE